MKALGYKVGKTGIQDAKKRHELLTEIFMKEDLPAVMSKDYLAEWGSPGSCQRLKKMADSIATFSKNAKLRKDADMTVAIEHWEEDLKWLGKNFYHGHCQFWWPSTKV
jgi:carboxypeptidase C (cathepsin A)